MRGPLLGLLEFRATAISAIKRQQRGLELIVDRSNLNKESDPKKKMPLALCALGIDGIPHNVQESSTDWPCELAGFQVA